MISGMTASQLLDSCYTCEFFIDLDRAAKVFSATVGGHFGPGAAAALQTLVALYVTLFGLRLMTSGGNQGDMARFLWTLVFSSAALVMLNNYEILSEWVFEPLESLALAYALELLSLFGNDGKGYYDGAAQNSGQWGYGYRELVALVEAQVTGVLAALATIFGNSGWVGDGMLTKIGAVLAMLPYMFVAGIFAAFLVEAMFSYLAIAIVAPILVLGIPFPMGRAFATAGLRILIGATLTIIFAAGAMGFTIATVDKHTVQIRTITATETSAEEKRSQLCGIDAALSAGGIEAEAGADTDNYACKKASGELDEIVSLKNKEFLLLFVMGFVSVLLHLKAKTLSSNLSGANDGAGPAAAVVGGAKMALGMGALAASRLGFGRGGIGTSMQAAIGSSPGGQHALQHGLVGGGVSAIVSRFRGTSGPATDAWNNAVGSAPFSAPTGGAASSADFAKMSKSIDNLTKVLTQAAPRLGSGQ